jgi:hypothetical protein
VFTARYALSPYIKQTCFVIKGSLKLFFFVWLVGLVCLLGGLVGWLVGWLVVWVG